jgi:hypothetical protein
MILIFIPHSGTSAPHGPKEVEYLVTSEITSQAVILIFSGAEFVDMADSDISNLGLLHIITSMV